MTGAAVRRPGPIRRFFSLEDGALIRIAFYLLLGSTISVLYVDYSELTELDAAIVGAPEVPIVPAFDPLAPGLPGPALSTDPEVLRQPLSVELVAGGVLELTGTIDPGSADRFRAEVALRREYVTTVSLNSPGGSVGDALQIGAMIAAEKFATSVAAGALCASSCPLVLASGTERHASPHSAIGVHQIYAALPPSELPTAAVAAGEAMSSAQRTTAAITRHLRSSGVDPEVWLHALETPPDRLYFLSSEELTRYRLVTHLEGAADPGG